MNPLFKVLLILVFSTFAAPSLAQVLLGLPDESDASRGTKPSSTPGGIVLGSPTATGRVASRESDVEDDASDPRLGGMPFLPGGAFRPGRMGMTREEIIRQKQEEAWKENLRREQEMRLLLRQFKVRESINELFEEPDRYVPTVLRNFEEPPANEPDTQKAEGGEAVPGDAVGTSKAPKKPMSEDRKPAELTEDERIDRELKERRAALDSIEDPEEKQRQDEALRKREKARKDWLEKRATAERGAIFFQISPFLQLRDQQLREGWCNLFDGKTFFGWRTQNEGPYAGGRFTIQDGEIRSDPMHPGLLYTTNQFGDATVMLEFQSDPDSEAFLLLRTAPNPRDLMSSCYAIVLNSTDYQRPRGTILGRHQLGIEQLMEQEKVKKKQTGEDAVPEAERWHKLVAQFDGTSLRIMIDRDDPIVLYDTKPLGYGYVGLLAAKGNIRFRNLFWMPGSSLSLFDGMNPEKSWRYSPDKVQLSATKSLTMQMTGGPGAIETKENYDNFVLQLEYNIAYTSARSGLFFRCTPREEQTGYEVSLQNFPTRQDRDALPGVDAGAFRGRKNGRYIRAQDQKWNYLTLVAVDRQFQTWVNGVPVCEISDRRPLSEADEKGPFLQPGTIRLSAPVENTSIQFRNIRVMPISARTDKPRSFQDLEKTTWSNQIAERKEKEKEKALDREMMEKPK